MCREPGPICPLDRLVTSPSLDCPSARAPVRLWRMWYVGGLAIGLVLVFVLVMVAMKSMRK